MTTYKIIEQSNKQCYIEQSRRRKLLWLFPYTDIVKLYYWQTFASDDGGWRAVLWFENADVARRFLLNHKSLISRNGYVDMITRDKDFIFTQTISELMSNTDEMVNVEEAINYGCPKCLNHCQNEKTLISSTESIFVTEPDPHYRWTETHKCQKCLTLYQFVNTT